MWDNYAFWRDSELFTDPRMLEQIASKGARAATIALANANLTGAASARSATQASKLSRLTASSNLRRCSSAS